jgi:hypothetical protein
MQIGPVFREKSEQYVCKWDKKTKTFVIIDLWNEKIIDLDVGDDIPEEAMTVLSEAQVTALFKEASRIRKIPRVPGAEQILSPQSEGEPSESSPIEDSERNWQAHHLKMRALGIIQNIVMSDNLDKLVNE